uniref:Uncharacterized protein n=1 Tax=Geospiza parvula TaxID=87175 RepID=A0A8C3M2D3_GEOPR
MGHHTDQLLPGSLALGGEVLAEVGGQHHDEVLGVHVQLVTVQFAQWSKAFLDAVQALDGVPEGGQHLLAMGTDHGVASDSSGAGQVPKGGKEPLGPGVDDQQPGERAATASPDTQSLSSSCTSTPGHSPAKSMSLNSLRKNSKGFVI